jgi:tight adherence protein B
MSAMNDERSLIAIFLVAAFLFGTLFFWMFLRVATTGVERYRAVFSQQAKVNLEQMFLFIDSTQLLTLNGLLLVAAGVLGWIFTGSIVGALVCCAIGFFVPRFLFTLFRTRRHRKLTEQLPDASMLISGSLRAGASLNTALQQMVAESRPPISQEFDLFLREQRLGVTFDAALDNLERRVDSEEIRLFSAALKVARDTGGNLAETLEQLASTLRQKLTIEGKIRALTAQGKLQGLIVSLLPFLVIAALFHLEPQAMDRLFTTWYGWATIGFIVLMELIGALIIKKIVTIDV